MSKVICIGELLIDFIPIEKGLALKDVPQFKRIAGGAPANVAACVSILGGNSVMISKLGNDSFGDHLIEVLDEVHVNTSHIKRTSEANTALAFVSLSIDGERDFSFYRNPSSDMLLRPDEVDETIFNENDILHFCSVDLVDYPVKKAHMKALEYAHTHNMIISFDPNIRFPLWPDKKKYQETIQEFIPLAHIIKISDDEVEFITGIQDQNLAIKSLFVGHVKIVILTQGKNGATIYTKTKSVFVPSRAVKAIDTTGAGDAFIGAIIFQILQHKITLSNIDTIANSEFLDFAHTTSSLVVLSKGAIPAMPTYQTVINLQNNPNIN